MTTAKYVISNTTKKAYLNPNLYPPVKRNYYETRGFQFLNKNDDHKNSSQLFILSEEEQISLENPTDENPGVYIITNNIKTILDDEKLVELAPRITQLIRGSKENLTGITEFDKIGTDGNLSYATNRDVSNAALDATVNLRKFNALDTMLDLRKFVYNMHRSVPEQSPDSVAKPYSASQQAPAAASQRE